MSQTPDSQGITKKARPNSCRLKTVNIGILEPYFIQGDGGNLYDNPHTRGRLSRKIESSGAGPALEKMKRNLKHVFEVRVLFSQFA